jgi:putative membrane protein
MGREVIDLDELKLSDKLAIARTIMAGDRTLLAWVRTSLSLISFGFTIYNILEYIRASGATRVIRVNTPRNIGIFMIVVGIIPLGFAMFQYKRTLKRCGERGSLLANPSMIAATAIMLLGFLLLCAIVMKLDPF